MAEIHVQAKKNSSSTWLWILVSLIIMAAFVVYLMMRDNTGDDKAVSKPNQTSSIMSTHEVGSI